MWVRSFEQFIEDNEVELEEVSREKYDEYTTSILDIVL